MIDASVGWSPKDAQCLLDVSLKAMSNTLTPLQSILLPSFHVCSVMTDLALLAGILVFLDPGLEPILSLSNADLPTLAGTS